MSAIFAGCRRVLLALSGSSDGDGPSTGDGLLLEDGFFFLLETGDFFLLE